jgi:uncharacterized glyoxalase superfamily protein PhnB
MKVHELFAYLCVRDAAKAIEFYRQAFGAEEKFRLNEPGGRIGHAELVFGGATLMLSDEFPEHGVLAPATDGATGVSIHLHVDNADEVMKRAAAAGATVERAPQDQFYGERSGTLRDPFGHRWNVGHHIEDVSFDEMQQRYTKMMKRE